jgi:WD40 repeat protein
MHVHFVGFVFLGLLGCARPDDAARPGDVAHVDDKPHRIKPKVDKKTPPDQDDDIPPAQVILPKVDAKQPVPMAGPSPLDGLDRRELAPMQRDEFPAEVVAVIPAPRSTILDLAFTPDGKRLAIARSDNTLEVWDLTGPRPVNQATLQVDAGNGWANRVAFSPNGAWMASVHGLPGKTLALWKMADDGDIRLFTTHQHLPRVENVAFHPDNKTLAMGGIGGELLNITDTGLEPLNTTFEGAVASYQFGPDGKSFAAIVFNQARNGPQYASEVKLWKVAGKNIQEAQLIQQNETIKALAVSPDRKTLATGSLDLKVRLWNLTAQPPTAATPFTMATWVKSLHFTPDGSRLIAVGSANHIVVWDMQKGEQTKIWNFSDARNRLTNIAFTASALAPDGRHLAISTFTPNTIILRLPAR